MAVDLALVLQIIQAAEKIITALTAAGLKMEGTINVPDLIALLRPKA